MARTVLTVQSVARTGLTPAYVAGDQANGHMFDNTSQRVMIHVKNGGSSSIIVTIPTPGTVDALAIADLSVSVPAGAERMIGPFPRAVYDQAARTVWVDLSADTSVTLGAFRVG